MCNQIHNLEQREVTTHFDVLYCTSYGLSNASQKNQLWIGIFLSDASFTKITQSTGKPHDNSTKIITNRQKVSRHISSNVSKATIQ